MPANPALCPNCGQTIPPDAKMCPNCGMVLPASAWPPAPQVLPSTPAVPPRLLSGKRGVDLTLGTLLVLLPFGLGVWAAIKSQTAWALIALLFVLASPGFYFALRRRYAVVARGVGWGWIWLAGLILLSIVGAFATCLVLLSHA